jgi:hypothetical protein
LAKFDLKEYARRGATVRAEELRAELAAIYRTFPELQRSTPTTVSGPRRRKPMTAAQKAAVGRRMKKYWAARRKQAGK